MGWLCESLGCLVCWGGGAGPQQLCFCLNYIFELAEVLFEIWSYGPHTLKSTTSPVMPASSLWGRTWTGQAEKHWLPSCGRKLLGGQI